jgi:hypothetical protein
MFYILLISAISSKITQMSLHGDSKKVLENLVERPKKIDVDWVTGNIYVVDQIHFPTIKVCNLEIAKCTKIFIAVGANDITSIAVDPIRG